LQDIGSANACQLRLRALTRVSLHFDERCASATQRTQFSFIEFESDGATSKCGAFAICVCRRRVDDGKFIATRKRKSLLCVIKQNRAIVGV
jgi:hypothetical protein